MRPAPALAAGLAFSLALTHLPLFPDLPQRPARSATAPDERPHPGQRARGPASRRPRDVPRVSDAALLPARHRRAMAADRRPGWDGLRLRRRPRRRLLGRRPGGPQAAGRPAVARARRRAAALRCDPRGVGRAPARTLPGATGTQPAEGVRLYGLAGASPSVRFATHLLRRPNLEGVLSVHRDPAFDPVTDAVFAGPTSEEGQRTPVAPQVLRETASQLVARVDAPAPGLLVWSRTFFSPWKATVDDVPAEPIRAHGHLVGLPVPAGRHGVLVYWSVIPVLGAVILTAVGLLGAAHLRR